MLYNDHCAGLWKMDYEEKRQHPRVDLTAEVRVKPGSEALIFKTRNISLGGVFIAGDPDSCAELKVGSHVQLRVCVADLLGKDITCRAQIIRVDRGDVPGRPAGFALRFFRLDMANTMRLGKLVDRRC